jgi:anti-sigma B factor antagonist
MSETSSVSSEQPPAAVRLVARTPGHLLVAVTGDLDYGTATTISEQVRSLDEGVGHIVLDLSGVGFCDSAGISALLDIWRQAQAREAWMVIAAPRTPVARTLHYAGLGEVIPQHATIEESLTALPSTAPTTHGDSP